jgi:DnaJ-class molecular chaperone
MSCDVCDGTPGRYPIHNKYGAELYSITCPECDGSGMSAEEEDADFENRKWQQKYDAAMAAKRAREVTP